jgi:hypothetical protein
MTESFTEPLTRLLNPSSNIHAAHPGSDPALSQTAASRSRKLCRLYLSCFNDGVSCRWLGVEPKTTCKFTQCGSVGYILRLSPQSIVSDILGSTLLCSAALFWYRNTFILSGFSYIPSFHRV